MLKSIIVAAAQNRVIGIDNDLPWRLPSDLKRFKALTLGHHILMGRKTWQSIGRPLPGRPNVVISRKPFFEASGCQMANSLEEAFQIAEQAGEEECFVIGGAEIYKQSLPMCDRIYLTQVEAEVDGDTFFPTIEERDWIELSNEAHLSDERHEFPFRFITLSRKEKEKD